MKEKRFQLGFSLLEALIVIAIIAILAILAIPSQAARINQKKILETIELVETFKNNVQLFYSLNGKFPKNNKEALMPEPTKIIGNYLEKLELTDGVMHLTLGKKLPRLNGQMLTIFPVYVKGSIESPISWVCGYGKPPEGMVAAGVNKTNIEKANLPIRCR